MKGELNGYLGAITLFWIVNILVLLNGLRERLVRKLKVGWKKCVNLEFVQLMVIFVDSLIVHICLIVEYFTEFSEVAVFRKNGF